MSTSDDDPDLPDTAMASGSDAGSAGEHLGPDDLEPDEQRLLEQLQRDLDARPSAASPSSVAEVRAAEDEAPLPAHGGSQRDGLDAVFDPPREG